MIANAPFQKFFIASNDVILAAEFTGLKYETCS